jgi:hypothetical protein
MVKRPPSGEAFQIGLEVLGVVLIIQVDTNLAWSNTNNGVLLFSPGKKPWWLRVAEKFGLKTRFVVGGMSEKLFNKYGKLIVE